jgi:hypothetical protein
MSPLLILIASLPWSFAAPSSLGTAGPTLFPESVRSGETLRFVVDGPVLARPRRAADTLAFHPAGEPVSAWAEMTLGGSRWVILEEGGWVEAARLDRPAEPLDEDPEPGREGLAAGRVLPWSWRPSDLVPLPDSLKAPGFEGKSLRLRREAAASFAELVSAARRDSVVIVAFSAFRPAGYQRRLYQRAVEADPDQRHSASPGRSEHQLGTTVDVGTPGTVLADAALETTAAGRWLEKHASEYGFVLTFSRERHAGRGVAFEPWHLRWVGRRVDNDRHW